MRADDPLGDLDAFALVHGHEGQGPPAALAQRHHNATGASLVFGKATVNAILDFVRRTNVTAVVRAVDFHFAV